MTPRERKTKATVADLLKWFSSNARDLPWRRTPDPYAIWVSEIMLQQTQVKTVIPYWERWMQALPTIEALASANAESIHKLWEGLGYYTRVRNMQKAAQKIIAEHGGHFPRDFEEILELPGIGPYTAGAIASIAFHEPKPILDGNVTRVLTRLFGITGNPREKSVNEMLWKLAQDLVEAAAKSSSQLNQSLMELGAIVCTPRNPQCPDCPLNRLCVAHRTGREEWLPAVRRRAPATRRQFMAFVVGYGGRFVVRQRPGGVVNAHLWEFPNVELNGAARKPADLARSTLGFSPRQLQRLGDIKHTITRYRITVEVFQGSLCRPPVSRRVAGKWVARNQLEALPFTAAHRRILRDWFPAQV